MVLLVDRLDQVKPLKKALEERRDAVPKSERPFEAVHTLLDFVPDDQAAKLPIVEKLRARLERAHERGIIAENDWVAISAFIPKGTLTAFGLADLPEELARPFSEKDGTRGRLVYVEPTAGKNDNDLHYLLEWADSFRSTRIASGETVLGSGRAVIFADMLRAVIADIPKAIGASLLLTAAAVLIAFRGGRAGFVIGALVIGIAWLAAFLAVSKVRINFLDFVALPITFGIGADYAVNVMQRYESSGDVVEALKKTGGAVVLCSLTTILGYIALLGSLNQAVRSLGLVAVAGEICCLVAAVLVLPAFLVLREKRASISAADVRLREKQGEAAE
jgi:predicted RND superfamily exporter protein